MPLPRVVPISPIASIATTSSSSTAPSRSLSVSSFPRLVFVSQHRRASRLQFLRHYPLESRAGGSGLQATNLSAAADLSVVQKREMSELSGKTGLAIVQVAVQDHSHAESPSDIDEQHAPLSVGDSAAELPVSHCPGVVVEGYRNSEVFLKNGAQRFVLVDEIRETVAGSGVDPSGKVNIARKHAFGAKPIVLKGFPDESAKLSAGILRVPQGELDILVIGQCLSLEVHCHDVGVVSFQIHSHKEPGLRIETEYAWSPPAGRAFFSKVLQPSVINQFPRLSWWWSGRCSSIHGRNLRC